MAHVLQPTQVALDVHPNRKEWIEVLVGTPAQEDPKVRAARTEDTVGPWIWEALVRAAHKKIATEGA